MRRPILERLASGEVLIADGATGTMLQEAGLPTGMPGALDVFGLKQDLAPMGHGIPGVHHKIHDDLFDVSDISPEGV